MSPGRSVWNILTTVITALDIRAKLVKVFFKITQTCMAQKKETQRLLENG